MIPQKEPEDLKEHIVIPAIVAKVEERHRLLHSRMEMGKRIDTTVSAGTWLTVMLSGGGAQLSLCLGDHTVKYKTGDLINIRVEPRS